MVASVGRITAGRGYDYLTKDVATSKHDYYVGRGEAPGMWRGDGAALLSLVGEVDADDMAALYGRFVVPSTAGGTRLPSGRSEPEQILGRKVTARTRADGSVSEPIAAFDVTFSPSKSVSVLWALSSEERVRDTVIDAHESAVADALAYLDAHAGHTRSGAGGVLKVAGQGFVIAQFRHRTARSTDPGRRLGDPQLHSHCAILNRVCGDDGKWRTLDSKSIYRHAHAAGAVYAATLERTLSEQLGVSWLEPTMRTPMREMAGVPDAVRDQFSTRRADVVATYSDLEDEWFAIHGRSPTRDEAARMRDQATIRSRNPKSGGDVDLHDQWRAMIRPADQVAIDRFVRGTNAADGGRLEPGSRELRTRVFNELHGQRAWWTRAHATAEVSRWIAQPTPESIEIEVERFIGECIALEPDDDPTYANVDEAKYTSATIQRAEEFVIDTVFERAPFRVDPELDDILGSDQAAAVVQLTRGSSRVSAVIGPAGAGKTTMLKSAASSYERAGRDVTVLCLSAVAARNVTQETGLEAETIASWKVGNIELPEGGLVIVDEASMVPTLTLADLCQATRQAGSRVALVGDYAQMGAPEAGGLLRDIAATPAACELTSVRRFRNRWEAEASVRLRRRDPSIATTYERQGRLSATTTDRAHEVVADAWILDETAGRRSIVVVDTNTDAAAVSAVCQQRLRSAGVIGGDPVGRGADQNQIHVGDRIQTRRNTSELTTSDGKRVLNRDVWRVTGSLPDGSLTAVHSARKSKVVITPEYLDRYAVLAYATTIAGAQGRTVDQGHVLVTPRTTAESLYVGMTRGRESNVAHVICDRHDHDELDLGRRTPSQAFAAAVARTSKSGWSARSIAHQWEADRASRRQERRADRAMAAATTWLAKHDGLFNHPRHRELLTSHGEEIRQALAGCATDDGRMRYTSTGLNAVLGAHRQPDYEIFLRAFPHQRQTRSSALSPVVDPGRDYGFHR